MGVLEIHAVFLLKACGDGILIPKEIIDGLTGGRHLLHGLVLSEIEPPDALHGRLPVPGDLPGEPEGQGGGAGEPSPPAQIPEPEPRAEVRGDGIAFSVDFQGIWHMPQAVLSIRPAPAARRFFSLPSP